ncbi:hypothetical protein [Vibrio sp. OPT18]|uniref:hypothetical protein n=1 Tax=Vibrio sp. OPT18 TaxID=2778641 RepID=UPI0018800AE1|nr:hypothetical protein [Vibrio sp. OPT18]MBE8578681.1 hypothetical protein [Vibrio sp. OPT18]
MKKNNSITDRTLDHTGSELSERLKVLIGDRAVRPTAVKWGLPISTVTNYLYKGTMPSADALLKIAKAEGVTMEFLMTGSDPYMNTKCDRADSVISIATSLVQEHGIDKAEKIIEAASSNNLPVELSEKAKRIGVLVSTLPDEDLKEILLLINEAQYCALVGEKFKPTNKKTSNG